MSKPVILSDLAQRQVIEISLWYRSRKRSLGSEFVDELDRVLSRFSEFPALYPFVYGDYRQALLKRFPYRVFYRETEARIEVLAVLHIRRDRDPFLRNL